jgi:dipeptide/tripeptide permease
MVHHATSARNAKAFVTMFAGADLCVRPLGLRAHTQVRPYNLRSQMFALTFLLSENGKSVM